LRLDIDDPLRRFDHRHEQLFDLAHFLDVADRAHRPCDADLDILECRLQSLRPGIAVAGRRRQVLARRGFPAASRKTAKRHGGILVDRHGRIVPGIIDAPRERPLPPRLLVLVVPRVPAVGSDVDPAAKGGVVVDHQDLLVVARIERVSAVPLEIDLLAQLPAAQAENGGPAPGRLQQSFVPDEDVDAKIGRALRKPGEKRSQRGGRSRGMLFVVERDAGVEVPSDDDDLVLGPDHRAQRQPEIGGGIDDERGPIGPLHPPAIAAGLKERAALLHTQRLTHVPLTLHLRRGFVAVMVSRYQG
jgi:hypothetical protein